MDEQKILTLMNAILVKRGKVVELEAAQKVAEIGFRSLDFSELALRVELQLGRPLKIDAAQMRKIETVGDITGFFTAA